MYVAFTGKALYVKIVVGPDRLKTLTDNTQHCIQLDYSQICFNVKYFLEKRLLFKKREKMKF